ncbi:MAG: ATP-binding protein [Acidimicrobiales bacterium]
MPASEQDMELPAAPASVGSARRFVGGLLEDFDATSVSDVASLLTSELVTNAIVHAGGRVRIRVTCEEGIVRVSVEDSSNARPYRRRATEAAVTGRGLTLVEELASSWGVDPLLDGRGKSVWFELCPDRRP